MTAIVRRWSPVAKPAVSIAPRAPALRDAITFPEDRPRVGKSVAAARSGGLAPLRRVQPAGTAEGRRNEFRAATSISRAAPPRGPLVAIAHRTPELTWRRSALAPEASAADPMLRGTNLAFSERGRVDSPLAHPPAAQPTRDLDRVHANLLDRGLIDRLADDVIRRVERHVRIERERRGI
jgi:hypothetical protein